MSRLLARGAEFWATVVAEAKQGAIPRVAVAAKHGVSDAALKYHLYKSTGSTSVKSKAPTLLPVRLRDPADGRGSQDSLYSPPPRRTAQRHVAKPFDSIAELGQRPSSRRAPGFHRVPCAVENRTCPENQATASDAVSPECRAGQFGRAAPDAAVNRPRRGARSRDPG
jgi:hypothetical protein